MNARPEPAVFGGFGEPPARPPGAKRLWSMVKAATGKTIFAGAILLVWHAYAPEQYRPEVLFGTITGLMHGSEVDAAAAAQVRLQGKMSSLNNEMQMRLLVAQTTLQQQVQSENGMTGMANVADATCWGSILVAGIAQAFDSYDIRNGASKVGGVACGMGNQIRRSLTQQQQDLSQGLLTMASAGFDHHVYAGDDAKALSAYWLRLPNGVREELASGMDLAHPTADTNAVLGDRLVGYYRQHGI